MRIRLQLGRGDGEIKVSTVTLRPGATAHSLLGIHNADAYPAQLCDKVTAASLKIYPPNETTPVYVAFQFSACSATGTHQMVGAVEAGPGNPEQVSR